MMMESIFITAFTVGVLGGVHCLGMCGGVIGVLSFNLKPEIQLSYRKQLPYLFAYNFGRISSYVFIGLIFGWLGSTLVSLTDFLPFQQGLQLFAGLFMIALGLYLAGWWNGVVIVERLGSGVWKKLTPLAKKISNVQTLPQAVLYGLVWGWLPCGLVYSMLIMALSAGSALNGGLVMLAFGLGTLPNLILFGSFAFFFTRLSRNKWARNFAGLSVIGMGCWQIWLALSISV